MLCFNHDVPFQMRVFPAKSAATQNDGDGHETALRMLPSSMPCLDHEVPS